MCVCTNVSLIVVFLHSFLSVTVSLVSIRGQECRAAELGQVATRTGGTVTIVDPQTVTEEFTSILANPIIATNTISRVILHYGLLVHYLHLVLCFNVLVSPFFSSIYPAYLLLLFLLLLYYYCHNHHLHFLVIFDVRIHVRV